MVRLCYRATAPLRRHCFALLKPSATKHASGLLSKRVATVAAAATNTDTEDATTHSRQDDSAPDAAHSTQQYRRSQIQDVRPFSDVLTDAFRRRHDYLRISVTERCNLRCLYCMPQEGVPLSPPKKLLTTPEIVALSSIFVSEGVTKIRLTGGEPTVRRDIVPLMRQLGDLRPLGLKELCLTTNGLSLHRKLDSMVEAGLTGVNLSLDTLDPWQFQIMTRRKGFDAVMKSIDRIFEMNRLGAGIRLKINCVVMRGVNDSEILPFVEMTRDKNLEVRFIEYMPFDGNRWSEGKMFSYSEMLHLVRSEHPRLEKVQDHQNNTSKTFGVPGFEGRIGFITSMTHNFCGTCNRLRITSDGNLKVCLFGNAEVSLRDILRKANNGEPIDEEAYQAIRQTATERLRKHADENQQVVLAPNSQELLDVIGMAVRRKKAKHAGIGELEHMKNRPMILIDSKRTKANITHIPAQWSTMAGNTGPKKYAVVPFSYLTLPQPVQWTSLRNFSTQARRPEKADKKVGSGMAAATQLSHVAESGSAHMVSISEKTSTNRIATAVSSVRFSSRTAPQLIKENQVKKGDVLGVARVAGIMASKRTSELIPLCHPIAISHVSVDLKLIESDGGNGRVDITATVTCDGKTGVEMEALTAASTAALTVYDMCKAVDKGITIEGLKVILKDGGKSGRWVQESHAS